MIREKHHGDREADSIAFVPIQPQTVLPFEERRENRGASPLNPRGEFFSGPKSCPPYRL